MPCPLRLRLRLRLRRLLHLARQAAVWAWSLWYVTVWSKQRAPRIHPLKRLRTGVKLPGLISRMH